MMSDSQTEKVRESKRGEIIFEVALLFYMYRKVASSRLVYYSILNTFGKRSHYISILFTLHKKSENPWMCY